MKNTEYIKKAICYVVLLFLQIGTCIVHIKFINFDNNIFSSNILFNGNFFDFLMNGMLFIFVGVIISMVLYILKLVYLLNIFLKSNESAYDSKKGNKRYIVNNVFFIIAIILQFIGIYFCFTSNKYQIPRKYSKQLVLILIIYFIIFLFYKKFKCVMKYFSRNLELKIYSVILPICFVASLMTVNTDYSQKVDKLSKLEQISVDNNGNVVENVVGDKHAKEYNLVYSMINDTNEIGTNYKGQLFTKSYGNGLFKVESTGINVSFEYSKSIFEKESISVNYTIVRCCSNAIASEYKNKLILDFNKKIESEQLSKVKNSYQMITCNLIDADVIYQKQMESASVNEYIIKKGSTIFYFDFGIALTDEYKSELFMNVINGVID